MKPAHANPRLTVFSTCPPCAQSSSDTYLHQLQQVARWSEDAGCEGILVYTDNRQVDPWLASQAIITATRRLSPLVAVQPVYMHPYSVAKMVTSLAFLHGRRVHLNLVAGGFKNDLEALDDKTPHDQRYERLTEYTSVIQQLLQSPDPVSYDGSYYRVNSLKLIPSLPRELTPGVLVSGSSEAGMQAARRLGATPIEYPRPTSEYSPGSTGTGCGMRIGIIARDTDSNAWNVAHARFPPDRKGQITHELAMKTSDSSWHQQLSERARTRAEERSPYWLVPFENYKSMCPYLVGSYVKVSDALACYVNAGYHTFILDVPPNPEELQHVRIVLGLAAGAVAA